MNKNSGLISLMWLVAGLALSLPVSAQRAGQSVSIQYGEVAAAQAVDLQSGAVPGGVLVGGGLGLASASGKSSSKKVRNALVGAAAGAAIGKAGQGSNSGMLYTIDLGDGGRVQVVTDQREIRIGDCVAVERAGETTNVRRMSSGYCDQASAAAVKAVEPEAKAEAQECLMAKQQLVEAATAEQADLAARKIQLLCDD